MDHLESGSNTKQSGAQLISGLPEDIALFCLAGVPRKYHTVLKCVSRRWRDLLHSGEWCTYRRKHNLDETWIYALCRDNKLERVCCYVMDPSCTKRNWKLIQKLPACALRRKGMGFEELVLGKNASLLGGCGWSEDATREVYCHDTSMNKWTEAASMSTASFDLSGATLLAKYQMSKIYSIGGLGTESSDTHSWDVYDPCTNSWKLQTDPNIVTEIEDSFVMDGKIYICSSTPAMTSNVRTLVYEPSSGIWQHADADMASGWWGPAVVVDGTLYVLNQSSGTRLMMFQKQNGEWTPFGRLSPLLTGSPCQLVAVGKNIFVIGRGCSTVVIDVGNPGNSGGVIVSSSIPKLNDNDDVVSCKCLAI